MTPSRIDSVTPPAEPYATVGVPCSAASITARPQPSRTDGSSIATDEARMTSRSSASTRPHSSTRSEAPCSATYSRSEGSHQPEPITRSRRPGCRGASATTASTACSSRLWGTSRLKRAQHGSGADWLLARSPLRSVRYDVHRRRRHPEIRQVGRRRARDGQERQPPVGADRGPLDPPAEPPAPAGVDHPPLLAVQVVHQRDGHPGSGHAGAERDAVDDLHDRVAATSAADRDERRGRAGRPSAGRPDAGSARRPGPRRPATPGRRRTRR